VCYPAAKVSEPRDETPAIRDSVLEFLPEDEAREIEDTLWWRVGRQVMLAPFLKRAADAGRVARILEIGCGSGGDLGFLGRFGRVTGVERSAILAERARSRGDAEQILEGDFADVTPHGEFDLICLLDVIEHVEDDLDLARRMAGLLDPGQMALLSVPACPALYGPHDELLHHHRRYSSASMGRLLDEAGFEVVRGTYFVFLLFPVFVLQRAFEKLRAWLGYRQTEVQYGLVPKPINAALVALLRFEAALLRFVDLPIGVWYVVLARRRGADQPSPGEEPSSASDPAATTHSTT